MLYFAGYAIFCWLCYISLVMLYFAGYAIFRWLCYISLVLGRKRQEPAEQDRFLKGILVILKCNDHEWL